MSFHIECRPVLSIATFYINSTNTGSGVEKELGVVTISEDSIHYEHNSTTRFVRFPSSFKLVISDSEKDRKYYVGEKVPVLKFKIESRLEETYPKKTIFPDDATYQIRCRECQETLLKTVMKFRRVLPLPSSDWRELAAEWFCHKDKSEKVDGKFGDLTPKADELFYSICAVVLHSDNTSDAVSKTEKSCLCETCQSHLGDVLGNCVEFTRTKIDIYFHASGVDELFLRNDALSVLRHLIMEQLSIKLDCRLVLLSKSTETVVLIWVMENNLQVCTGSIPPKEVDSTATFRCVHKILFTASSKTEGEGKDWLADWTVPTHTLPEDVIQEILMSLKERISPIPGNAFESFTVAFVPLE